MIQPLCGRHCVVKALWGALLLLWLSCTQLPAAQWTDAIGRTISLEEPPQRIVSLVPAVTETLFALGLGDRVVGVTDFCTFPPEARQKPSVGGYADPSLEAVATRRPDLVFLAADMGSPALLSRLEQLGVKIYVLYPRGLEEAIAGMRAVAAVCGVAEAGERLAKELEDEIARVERAVAGKPRPRVLFAVMPQPLTVAGPDTLVGDLLAAAGARNVVPPGANRYPTWGIESLLPVDPDFIVLSPHTGLPDPENVLSGWPELTAVREGRIISVDPDWVHRPGPRLKLGLRALANAFHGLDLSPPENQP